jgi:hypothetical protein
LTAVARCGAGGDGRQNDAQADTDNQARRTEEPERVRRRADEHASGEQGAPAEH